MERRIPPALCISPIVMVIFMGLYTIVDTIFAAQFVDADALFAIGNGISISSPEFLKLLVNCPCKMLL